MSRPLSASLGRRRLLQGGLAVALTVPAAARLAFGQSKRLNVYNWDTYIGPTTVDDFTKATGIEVEYDIYADNAELFAKLREGNPGYDIIVPTNDTIERLIQAEKLVALDHAKIPNLALIGAGNQNPSFDPGRTYTAPYVSGSVGIGYRKSAVETPPDSWAAIFDPASPYKGRISILGEPQTVVPLVLKWLGHSLNARDPGLLEQARAALLRARPNFRTIAGDEGQNQLAGGSVDLSLEFNGDVLQIMADDDDVGYVIPKEGTMLWQDCLCIPTGAPNVDNAHAWIDFVLTAQNHAAIAAEIQYYPPNDPALALMPEAFRTNPAINPPAEIVAKSEYAAYPGEDVQRFFDETMTRLRAG